MDQWQPQPVMTLITSLCQAFFRPLVLQIRCHLGPTTSWQILPEEDSCVRSAFWPLLCTAKALALGKSSMYL